jgi:hypothetical protein
LLLGIRVDSCQFVKLGVQTAVQTVETPDSILTTRPNKTSILIGS